MPDEPSLGESEHSPHQTQARRIYFGFVELRPPGTTHGAIQHWRRSTLHQPVKCTLARLGKILPLPQIDGRSFGRTASVSAVLLLKAGDRAFAITFGPGGRFLIDKTKTEERFGLLAVLNSIPENRLRSMDKTAFDALATHSRVQTSREASAIEFGLDVERDLVRAVTGSPDEEELGHRLQGVDSLKATVRIGLADLPGLLRNYLARYRSTNYKKNFPWIDHIAEVKDTVLRHRLDEKLLEIVQRRELDTCWLAVPEIVDWDRIHRFRYGRGPRNPTHHDIDLGSWLTELTDTTKRLRAPADVDLKLLSNRKVVGSRRGWQGSRPVVNLQMPQRRNRGR